MSTYSEHVQTCDTTDGFVCGSSGKTAQDIVPALKIVGTANAAAANVIKVTNASHGQATILTIQDPGATAATLKGGINGFAPVKPVCTITAGTTQTQAGATAVTANVAYVTTGNVGDGVILPALSAAMIGTEIRLINASVNNGTVYCPGTTSTNTINGTAGATGVTYAASKTLSLVAVSATAWVSNLSN